MFIERSRDASPEGIDSLAAAVARTFGVGAEAIAARLRQGRFRVKASVPLEKAERLRTLLEGVGAVCSVVDEQGRPVPAAGRDDALLTLADDASAPTGYEGALSAASSSGDSQELGVLGSDAGEDNAYQLATLDGTDDERPGQASAAAPSQASEDAFLPPEMMNEQALELLTPPPEAMPVEPQPPPAPAPAPPRAAPAAPRRSAAVPIVDAGAEPASEDEAPRQSPLVALASNERLRLAVGAALAVLIGFLAAHVHATARESSYAEVIGEVREAQALATTEERWSALDELRASALARLDARHTSIVITSMVLWLVVAAGIGFLWLRAVDWSRWAVDPASAPPPRA